jgi:hypothetical protein
MHQEDHRNLSVTISGYTCTVNRTSIEEGIVYLDNPNIYIPERDMWLNSDTMYNFKSIVVTGNGLFSEGIFDSNGRTDLQMYKNRKGTLCTKVLLTEELEERVEEIFKKLESLTFINCIVSVRLLMKMKTIDKICLRNVDYLYDYEDGAVIVPRSVGTLELIGTSIVDSRWTNWYDNIEKLILNFNVSPSEAEDMQNKILHFGERGRGISLRNVAILHVNIFPYNTLGIFTDTENVVEVSIASLRDVENPVTREMIQAAFPNAKIL